MTTILKKDVAADTLEAEVERLKNHPAVGMWADREDMKDPVEWVRSLRRRRREKFFETAGGDAE